MGCIAFTDYGRPMKPFINNIPNFWANSADHYFFHKNPRFSDLTKIYPKFDNGCYLGKCNHTSVVSGFNKLSTYVLKVLEIYYITSQSSAQRFP